MKDSETSDFARVLKLLPSTDAMLRTQTAREILSATGAKFLTLLIRQAIAEVRQNLKQDFDSEKLSKLSREDLSIRVEEILRRNWRAAQQAKLQKVINATGVIIHTNLGRAPLSEDAKRAVAETAAGYCNLEYDLTNGNRGRRGADAEKLLAEITGAESALIVTNCAAAAFLVLTVFASGGEAIISRGELVEIGGDFRVPDVLTQSGASLKEVGTTNRTKISDYENAVNEKTKMLLRVHPSNYRIVGFTETPSLKELGELARKKDLVFYEDAGSGALLDLSNYGLRDEPIISESVKTGVDIITFSGDKLLGGAQSGLIVGKKDFIEKLRKHPLYRALRVDKIIYAALEATLESFRRETAVQEIPVLKMLSMSAEELTIRSENFAEKFRESNGQNSDLRIEIIAGNSVIGGGSAPTVAPETVLLSLKHKNFSVSNLEKTLRFSTPPVIARIVEDKVLLDLRTVSESEESVLLKILAKL